VLGQLSWKDESDSRLDLPGRDGAPLVVAGESSSLLGNPLKDVVDERVHDDHGLLGDSSIGMNLLEDLEQHVSNGDQEPERQRGRKEQGTRN